MASLESAAEKSKRAAGRRAVDFVSDGMRLGLGTGSTVAHFLTALGERVREGLNVVGVPTSERTLKAARDLGIPVSTLDETPELDLVVDGADEFDDQLRLIKGGGGALLREKIVASASRRMIVIADGSKKVAKLGRFPLPVEISPFGVETIKRNVAEAAGRAGCAGLLTVRPGADGHPFVTDGGHYILDCAFGAIDDPERLAAELSAVPGVLGHGLFIGMADLVILAAGEIVEEISKQGGKSAASGE